MPEDTYCISSNFSVYADFTQVITTKQWRAFALRHDRNIFCQGKLRKLKATSIGGGLMEVTSHPVK